MNGRQYITEDHTGIALSFHETCPEITETKVRVIHVQNGTLHYVRTKFIKSDQSLYFNSGFMSVYTFSVKKDDNCSILLTTNADIHMKIYQNTIPCRVEQKHAGLTMKPVNLHIDSTSQVSWSEAQSHCQTLGAHLLTIHSPWEVKEIKNLHTTNYVPAIYIGLQVQVS